MNTSPILVSSTNPRDLCPHIREYLLAYNNLIIVRSEHAQENALQARMILVDCTRFAVDGIKRDGLFSVEWAGASLYALRPTAAWDARIDELTWDALEAFWDAPADV